MNRYNMESDACIFSRLLQNASDVIHNDTSIISITHITYSFLWGFLSREIVSVFVFNALKCFYFVCFHFHAFCTYSAFYSIKVLFSHMK